MISIDLNSLAGFLRDNKYDVTIQSETQQVYTNIKIGDKTHPFFLRIFDKGKLIQLLAFIPCKIQQGRNADVARLLHLLNKELDVPGFGMDEISGAIFYRIMLPTSKDGIDKELLQRYTTTIERACEMFTKAIETVAYGVMSIEEILAKANEVAPKPTTPKKAAK